MIFDSTILKHSGDLKGTAASAWLMERIGPDVSVQVVSNRTAADEAVLNEAADPNTVAVSCDNFDEYRINLARYPALAENRVIDHQITEHGRIFIKLLGVEATWKNPG